MKIRLSHTILALIPIVFLSCSSNNSIGEGTKQSLFNGEDLTGWNIHGTEKWFVEDGDLICESGPDKEYGYLSTDRKFKNFELSLEFLQEAEGNSGVFFRSSIEGVKISGWQVEVAPPDTISRGLPISFSINSAVLQSSVRFSIVGLTEP